MCPISNIILALECNNDPNSDEGKGDDGHDVVWQSASGTRDNLTDIHAKNTLFTAASGKPIEAKAKGTYSDKRGGKENHGQIRNLLHSFAVADCSLSHSLHTSTILEIDAAEDLPVYLLAYLSEIECS